MRGRQNWLVCMILMAAMLAGCSASPPEASDGGNTAVPTESPIQSMEPEPSGTPEPTESPLTEESPDVEKVYPIASQEDAVEVLRQAYLEYRPSVIFDFQASDMSLQDRSILLQNASSQLIQEQPELKYAYALECVEGPEGTVCNISYMPYKLGYPDGIPEGSIRINNLSQLISTANDNLGAEEIPIAICNPELLVDDMQRALQQAGYGYIVYMLNSDGTAIKAFPSNGGTLEESTAGAQEALELARAAADKILSDGMTDEEKLRAIYRYIVENTTYDNRYYENPAALPHESRTAVGPLKNGTAICGGFSLAFQMLCQEAGIPCWTVTGTGAGEDHMWNCAKLDGEYYYFDTTWDRGTSDETLWIYFACTEEEINWSHQWGIGQEELIHALIEEQEGLSA